jgi:MFS transporter, PPP family, 3-phenylpropionic acid transporter
MTPQFRTALYFFVQFFAGGAFHAYGGIWFASKGFSANQIAALSTFPTFVVLFFNVFSGRIADRASDWRKALVIGSILSFLPTLGLLFSSSYPAIFVCWTLAIIAQTLIVPIADGAALYLTQQGRGQIGTLRSLSTIGYIACLFLTGYVINTYGGAYYALLFVALSAMRPLAAIAMPDFRAPTDSRRAAPVLTLFQHLKSPGLFLPLVGWGIVYSTLQVLNSFLSLILSHQGLTENTIGTLFAVGAFAEAIVFFLFRHISLKVDLRVMILLSCAVTILRWIAMTFEPGLPWLYALQSLHGICYGLGFISCITCIGRNTPPNNAAEVQSLFSALQMITAIVTITIFGMLTQAHGSQAFWFSAAMATAGFLLALLGFLYPVKAKF